jgi:hypothetical protein
MSDMPRDPMSLLAEGATATHELFLSYVQAGFTEAQALYLVGQMLAASVRPTS